MKDAGHEKGNKIPAGFRLFSGLGSFIEILGEMLEEDSKERKIAGEIKSGKNLRGTYGINVILDPVNIPSTLKTERNANIFVPGKKKKESRFEIYAQESELLVVGPWGEYTDEETDIKVRGKTLHILGKKKGSNVTESLELPGPGYIASRSVYNNGILQITLIKDPGGA